MSGWCCIPSAASAMPTLSAAAAGNDPHAKSAMIAAEHDAPVGDTVERVEVSRGDLGVLHRASLAVQFAVGWIRWSCSNAPLRTRTTNWPFASPASTPDP